MEVTVRLFSRTRVRISGSILSSCRGVKKSTPPRKRVIFAFSSSLTLSGRPYNLKAGQKTKKTVSTGHTVQNSSPRKSFNGKRTILWLCSLCDSKKELHRFASHFRGRIGYPIYYSRNREINAINMTKLNPTSNPYFLQEIQ